MSFSYATLPFPLQSLQAYKGSIQSNIQRFLHVLIANSQHFWIRTRARNVLFCLTKTPSHHVSWICKCFQADPRAQACTIAATVQKQTTCHRRNMQAMHLRYRHQQCPASSKDQEHNRSTTVSLGSTIMQPLS